MASSVLPLIAQGPRPVQIDPTLGLQRRVQLGELAAQQQERMAQAQTLQAQAAERQRALQSQQAMHQAFIEGGGDWDKIPTLAAQYGATTADIQAGMKANQDLVTSRMANDKTQNELAISHHDQLRGQLNAIAQLPPEQQTAAIQNFWTSNDNLWSSPAEKAAAQQTFGNLSDPQIRNAFDATLNMGSKAAAEANERQKSASDFLNAQTAQEKEKREATTAAALLPGQQAESQKQQMIVDAMKAAAQNPSQGQAAIDLAIPAAVDGQANAAFKAAWAAAMQAGNIDGAAKIVAAAADHAASISPAKQQFEIGKAVAQEKAEAPVKIAESIAQAKAMNGTGAVANVPPHLAPTAISDYNKSAQALAAAQTTADDVQAVLDLAASGNKAAGANVPLVGVGALNAVNGIKRINSAEIGQYGTAGSLLDKIQGKLQGWTQGQPIPKDVLDDMKTLHDQLAQGAQTKHEREVQVINNSYGSNFQPMKFQPKAPAASGGGTIKVRRKSDGRTGSMPAANFDASKYDRINQ